MSLSRLTGAFALASGVAYLAYFLPTPARDGAITAWNLLIIPTTVYLGVVLARRGPVVAAASMATGIVASLLWAFDYKSPTLEPVWIGLAATWWFGVGWLLRRENRRLGWFTLILSAATAIDFVLTALNAPFPIYALGGFKIPLTIVWTFWVGAALVRGRLSAGTGHRAATVDQRNWSGASALVGGLLWACFGVGWTLSHGSTQDPRGETLLGLGAHEFTRLFSVPAILWGLAVVSNPAWRSAGGRLVAQAGGALLLVGLLMVGLGAVLQTSIVDPDLQFRHPAVQGGWILFVAGLFPALTLGMLLAGLTSPTAAPAERALMCLIGLLAPLPVVAFFLSGASDGGAIWDAALAAMHAAPGLGWMGLGAVLLTRAPAGVRPTAASPA